jgi:hypothetical protein
MNIKRYLELAIIQKQDLLTFEEQEDYIAISTELFNLMISADETTEDILQKMMETK